MSFFFTKEKTAAKQSALPRASNASKAALNRQGCKACPLDKAKVRTPKMLPDLADETLIYVLGEGPSSKDDKNQLPASDKTGELLRSLFVSDFNVSFDNVIRDFNDPFAAKPVQPWVAMECCRGLVTKSIEKAKPKIIIGLGITPLQWMLNSSDMVGLRGRVFAVQVGSHKCWFLPTYAPQFIMDNAYDDAKPLQSKLGHCLKFDIARAVGLANKLAPPTIDTPEQARAGVQAFNGQSRTQLAILLALISEARRAPEKAIDLETSHLRPYAKDAKILTAAISFRNTNFSFALDHPKAGWMIPERREIKAALKMLLCDPVTIIAHNTPFEIEWLIKDLGKDAIYHDSWECTMMQSHFLDERRGKRGNDDQYGPNPYQALDFLVKQHFGLAYKALFKLDRKNMAQADLDETLVYNGADTKYTLRLYHYQTDRLKMEGLWDAYREAVARQPTVALMQTLGIKVDQSQTNKFRKQLGGEIEEIEKRIQSYKEVASYIRDRKSFNPASPPDVLQLLKSYVKEGTSLLNADGKESVDKIVLERVKHPVAKDIEEFRNRSKNKSTYVDPFVLGEGAFIWPDGRIHQSLNTTFAETGRTSSDSPNNQNWPSRNEESKALRKQIVASKGHALVAFDYGQLEGCTGAMCSKDKTFVKALWEDYDMHMEWAQRAAKLYPAYIGGSENYTDKAVMKKFRGLVKNKLVFPAFFGAAADSIAGYLTAATGVEAPKPIIDKLFKDFWAPENFGGVHRWQKNLVSTYYETGFVESPTGRRRHYPLSRPQAINYPIQSVACDIVCRAMVRLSVLAVNTGKWYLHPIMNIHDDLTFDIPDSPEILEEAITTIYRTMLTPGYDFINVPLSVTCSVGTNWLEMDEVGKFYSHKDL